MCFPCPKATLKKGKNSGPCHPNSNVTCTPQLSHCWLLATESESSEPLRHCGKNKGPCSVYNISLVEKSSNWSDLLSSFFKTQDHARECSRARSAKRQKMFIGSRAVSLTPANCDAKVRGRSCKRLKRRIAYVEKEMRKAKKIKSN